MSHMWSEIAVGCWKCKKCEARSFGKPDVVNFLFVRTDDYLYYPIENCNCDEFQIAVVLKT